ncbi:large conductance mechanosensitive channel protein MscL [Rhodococcus sp. NPDC127528]|uniref:large conductance mechanosensitive channel protein MscL n=1 Tax=unclassified Rhodococcus (in: high G+C Gram-positive bacteria) TaxID=192944 RepID=UPI00362F3D03
MLKGFKDFLMKGDVLDLAVAVVIGAAFTAIVTAFTNNIVNPLIASIGSAEMGFGFQITDNPATFVNIGAVLTAAINFVIIAAVVYFVLIMPYNHAKQRFGKPVVETATDNELLGEIRDLLAESPALRRQ